MKAPFSRVHLPQWPFHLLAGSNFYFLFTLLGMLEEKNNNSQKNLYVYIMERETDTLPQLTFKSLQWEGLFHSKKTLSGGQ